MPTSTALSTSKKNQSGIIHLWLILLIIAIIIGGVVLVNNFKPAPSNKPVISPSSAPTVTEAPSTATPIKSGPTSTPTSQQVQKGDLAALEKYCKEEALKLPEAPFTYKSKEGPNISGPMPWIDQFIPKDKKQSEKKGCTMAYRFDGRAGYGSVGAKYPEGGREFDRAVRAGFLSKIDSSWKVITGKNISNDSLTLVLKRENPQMGTVDFVDVFDGGLVIYIKFNTYYK